MNEAGPADLCTHVQNIVSQLRQRVTAHAGADDLTAKELVGALDLSWALAERWRIENDEPQMQRIDDELREERQDNSAAM